MGKELSEMTIEELWALFPIVLVKPNPVKWNKDFLAMKNLIKCIIDCRYINSIHHIGSTAIKHIWAKDIVDVLIEFKSEYLLEDAANALTPYGFIVMSRLENRISLNYGYTKEGFGSHVFHIHLRNKGDINEIYFKNYLNKHLHVAKEYELLKLSLWKKHEHDRDAYTKAKTDFVDKWTKIAKEEVISSFN